MLMGLPDLFLRPGSALNFARHRVSRSKRGCGTQWEGRVGAQGALHVSTPSFLPPCPRSSVLTLYQP